MNLVRILLLVFLIYAAMKQKSEESRNVILIVTGLLAVCMINKEGTANDTPPTPSGTPSSETPPSGTPSSGTPPSGTPSPSPSSCKLSPDGGDTDTCGDDWANWEWKFDPSDDDDSKLCFKNETLPDAFCTTDGWTGWQITRVVLIVLLVLFILSACGYVALSSPSV